MEYTKIQLRRDTQANWSRYNPILAEGEVGIVTDLNKFKIGDGFTSFLLLPFATKSTDELDKELQGVQTQIDEINGANYQTAEQVEQAITAKNYATTAEVQAVEDKIPTDNKNLTNGADYATNTRVNEVEILANTKTTMSEVEGKGYQTSENVEQAITAKGYTTMAEVEQKQYQTADEVEQTITNKNYATTTRVNEVEGKIPTNNNQLTNGANYTTMAEVEAKDYATNTKVSEVTQSIPTDNAQLTNGADYATKSELPTPITIDTELSEVSENPLQNKVVTQKLNTLKGEVDSKTTSEQVEQAITAKNYVAKEGFATINNQSITDGGNIEIQGGGADITIDKGLDLTENPVENKAITNEVLDLKQNVNNINTNISNNLTFNNEVWTFTMEDGSVVTKNISIKEVNYFYIENASGGENNIHMLANSKPTPKLEYSMDKVNWTSWADPYTEHKQIPINGKLYLRGTNNVMGQRFVASSNINVGGDITTLLTPEGNVLDLSGRDKCFGNLFFSLFELINIEKLILPSLILSDNCYDGMFQSCKYLQHSLSVLPAMVLAPRCYESMFRNCVSLTQTPVLPATTLAEYCYMYMFDGCTSLTTAPVLPATTLASSCYSNMFSNCTSLTTAPVLPATTLARYCYSSMFINCTSLTTAPTLPATSLQDYSYAGMFKNCTALTQVEINLTTWNTTKASNWLENVAPNGTIIKPASLVIPTDTPSGVPSGWTTKDK